MTALHLTTEPTATGQFMRLADAIIATAKTPAPETRPAPALSASELLNSLCRSARQCDPSLKPSSHSRSVQYYLDQYFSDFSEDGRTAEEPMLLAPIDQVLANDPAQIVPYQPVNEERCDRLPRLPGEFVQVGAYEIRPSVGFEVPFGRDYQELPYSSISRLAGYIGLDDFSLYVREVPDVPDSGLRPSRNGVWVKQPHDPEYRRLEPGEAERISPETEIRIGGNGIDADTGLSITVH